MFSVFDLRVSWCTFLTVLITVKCVSMWNSDKLSQKKSDTVLAVSRDVCCTWNCLMDQDTEVSPVLHMPCEDSGYCLLGSVEQAELIPICWPCVGQLIHTFVCIIACPLIDEESRKTPFSLWGRTKIWWFFLHFWAFLAVNHEAPDQTSVLSPCKLYWKTAACWIYSWFSPGGKQMLSLGILE